MKFSLKTLAAAVALAAAAGSASAAIDNGATGNGELFFNVWDANGSYTRDLGMTIDAYQTALSAPGNLDLSWTSDATFASFLTGVSNPAALKWSIVANDNVGARRLLTSYTAPEPALKKSNDVIRSATLAVAGYVNAVNAEMGSNDSVAVGSSSAAYTGVASFSDNIGNKLNFSNAGNLSNNSFAAGLGFMRIDAASTGIASSAYNEYMEGVLPVRAWVDGNNTLHIAAAVPEPSEYALLLAGLGLMGAVARRRSQKQA